MKEIKTPVTDANQKRLSQIVTTSRPDALFVPVAVSEELEMNLTQAKAQKTCDHKNIYWKFDNLYCGICHQGMGNAYYHLYRENVKLQSTIKTQAERISELVELVKNTPTYGLTESSRNWYQWRDEVLAKNKSI